MRPLGLIAETRFDRGAGFGLQTLFLCTQIQRRTALGADDGIIRPRLGRRRRELRAAARRALERDLDLRHECGGLRLPDDSHGRARTRERIVAELTGSARAPAVDGA